MKNKIKKLGYGVAIHYNEYSKTFELYQIGSYHPGNGKQEGTKHTVSKSLKKAIKKYRKSFM